MAAAPNQGRDKARALLEQTGIIASEPHPLQDLIDPYVVDKNDQTQTNSESFIGLLQKQLQAEADKDWELACLPRPWDLPLEEIEARERLESAPKHELPTIVVPEKVVAGPRPLFPEVYLSVYASQDIESVPPVTNIAASLVRDGLLDTINILDFNRNVSARYLIDLDCYFADGTFVKRATPFDRLRDVEEGRSTWKPEDVAVDTVFSQLFQLPVPEHKLVYYHSVLTEACKIAPAAIAPSLGRAIRYLYRSSTRFDLELSQRFLDWFAHHLSNFGFTWKWTEWVEDVDLPEVHPRKAFVLGALDKEIRLSFAMRIKGTLPQPLQQLIPSEKEQDVPSFKFNDESEHKSRPCLHQATS
jgi:nuclear cap-binding protein subunit 1